MSSKKNNRIKPLRRFSRTQLYVFVLVFAAVGGYFIYRSFAATSYILAAPNIDSVHSVIAAKVKETSVSNKQNNTVIQLANSSSLNTAKVALTSSQFTLPKAQYQVCANMRTISGSISGKLVVNGINGGVLGKALSSVQSFTISNSSGYRLNGCVNFSYDGSVPSVEVTVSNVTAGSTLRVGSVLIKPVGSLTSTTTSNNCSDTNLKFCDDFTGSAGSMPDSSKWSVLTGASGWGVECFTNSPNNISQDGSGNLKLVVRKESGCGRSYTSGGMQSGDSGSKFKFHYGEVEIRAKVACGGGVWPALWTSTADGPSWPNSGEIDILEVMDGDQYDAQQTIHGGPNHWQVNTTNKASTRWCDNWHIYGVNWRKGSIQFKIDGVTKHTITPSNIPSGQTWPFDTYNQRLLVDLQIGSWGGTINDNDLPSSMLVDYVKVYN